MKNIKKFGEDAKKASRYLALASNKRKQ